MSNAYQVVRDFEKALCDYTGASYAVTTRSCTDALLIAVAWHTVAQRGYRNPAEVARDDAWVIVEIPSRTYVGVAQSVVAAGGFPKFISRKWAGTYRLRPLNVWDCARRFTGGMFTPGQIQCVSFHHTKILGLAAHGGAILHDDPQADEWLRRARFDGRKEGVPPRDDEFSWGIHTYMTPAMAAEGLQRLATLPASNADLPWGPGTTSDYSDLSTSELFA